jgi:hypothetical protein
MAHEGDAIADDDLAAASTIDIPDLPHARCLRHPSTPYIVGGVYQQFRGLPITALHRISASTVFRMK